MSRRVLMACYEVPGWGGANTSNYRLYQKLKQDGLDVCYLNLLDEQDVDFFRYVYGESFGNPKLLEDVHNCVLKEPIFEPHPGLADLIQGLAPDLLLGDAYIAALLLKRAAPEKPVIFYTAGCNQVLSYIATRTRLRAFTLDEFLRRARDGRTLFHDREKEAVEAADLIITHADVMQHLYSSLFPFQSGKVLLDVLWRAEWIAEEASDYITLQKPFSCRDIDLIFVSNSWLRPEKNYKLVRKIASRCRGLNIHVVGEVGQSLPRVRHHGLITRRPDLFALLGRAKAILCPSLFDAAPGVLWEASVMGCNVIASRNCGNWMLCHDELLVDPVCLDSFVDKITLAQSSKLDDNMGTFLQTNSYEALIDTLAVF